MRKTMKKLLIAACLMLLPVAASAQLDNFGYVDTLYVEASKINDANWSITVSYSNDQSIVGMSIPLKMTAGLNRIVADSAIYTGGRVEHFAYKGFRPDTAIQCVTLGLLANLGPTQNTLTPGQGRLVTVFVSSLEDKPIEKLAVDTTTTHPNNSLMVIAAQVTPKGDTIQIQEHIQREIRPHFVVVKQ